MTVDIGDGDHRHRVRHRDNGSCPASRTLAPQEVDPFSTARKIFVGDDVDVTSVEEEHLQVVGVKV
jgi:hypothetical protein